MIAEFGARIVRGDDRESSDLDMLVEFTRPVSLSAFLALEDELRAATGRDIDLVTRQSLKPYIGRNVLRELAEVRPPSATIATSCGTW